MTILVNDAPPSNVTYAPSSLTLTKDVAMTSITPTMGGGAVTSWTVSPALPAGLSLNNTTGVISGTPTAVTPLTNYTITASNAGGSNSTIVTLQVNDVVPSIEYLPNDLSMTNNTATILALQLYHWCRHHCNMVSRSNLPSGLAPDTTTGEITGTPTELLARTCLRLP